ncbi:hypothetical protein C1645_880498 [Glomus cerebriforme]|uniref:Uncharacterized protein n=1 Tax=Glomus cerebriforme TaxID=658196 RepID=A0A397SAU8_9GLOM|nr:hypothetical protein C1645_880498 [Glomus cerebriforme]
MCAQRVSFERILRVLLDNINYEAIYNFLHNVNVLAANFENGRRATARSLMRQNVRREAQRLHIQNHYIISMATNRIWIRSTRSQRQTFVNMALAINRFNRNRRQITNVIDNTDTLYRIAQINVQQDTNTPFERDFFNGVTFQTNNPEDWLLPIGFN